MALKKFFLFFGIDTHKFLFSVFERNSGRISSQKLSSLDESIRDLVLSEDETAHFGDIEVEEQGSIHAITSFTIDRINFIRDVSVSPSGKQVIADLGDSNGIFLRSTGQKGISVNISMPALLNLRKKGMEVVKADIEHLPFREESINTVYLFETLEHVPNPVSLLNEIARVCSDSLVLSIPHVSTTQIHLAGYDPTKPQYQHHVFEFSPGDFHSVITHTPFEIAEERVAVVIDRGGSLSDRIILFLWRHFMDDNTFCGCFREFYMCSLNKRK